MLFVHLSVCSAGSMGRACLRISLRPFGSSLKIQDLHIVYILVAFLGQISGFLPAFVACILCV